MKIYDQYFINETMTPSILQKRYKDLGPTFKDVERFFDSNNLLEDVDPFYDPNKNEIVVCSQD